VGFAIGLDRALLVLEERGLGPAVRRPEVFVVAMDATRAAALPLVRALRREFAVECDVEGRGMGAQFKAADKAGARLVAILGEEEWARGEVTIKDLANGTQQAVAKDALAAELRARLAAGEETTR
jgi:histidyl-tRNA synthetase